MTDDDSIWGQRLDEFREALATNQPAPGCGAAAAVVTDIGLALVLKGLRISEARKTDDNRLRLLEAAERLLGRPGTFADHDMQAFSEYLSAPQNCETDEPRMQAASRQACAVPLATAHSGLEALALALAAWPIVAPMLRSDVHAGALLIHAGLSAALLNIDADLAAVEDVQSRVQACEARRILQTDADRCLQRLNERVLGQASDPN